MAKVTQATNFNSAIINDFAGVDFSSPLLSVADNHAVDMKNFLKIDGVNQKRKGWIQRSQLPDRINGLWNFKATNELDVYIAHSGTNLYQVSIDENSDVYDWKEIDTTDLGVEDFRSSAVYSNHKLYIFCGNLLVIKYDSSSQKMIAKKVQDDDETTIPLTTMGITAVGSSLGGTRVSLDDVNMMTKWRYNSCKTSSESNSSISKENPLKFILDGHISLTATLKILPPAQLGQPMKTEWVIDERSVSTPVLEIIYQGEKGQSQIRLEGTPALTGKYFNATCYNFYNDGELVACLRRNVALLAVGEEAVAGSEGGSILELYKDYINPLDGEDNILIKFDGSFNAGADKINKCRFCKVYGYGGNRDTLFASGNPDYPNMDFHSSNNAQSRYKTMENRTFGDFTYWSDLGYNSYGSDENHVANYEVMGDGTLCVLKTESDKESTIYFRTGEFVQARSYDGVLIDSENNLTEIEYPCSVGAIGEAPYPYDKTMLNLNGDTLFLSKNGLFGLSYSSNITSNQRYSYARSRLVNKRLLTEELDKATACVFDNKYWLSFPNGHTYVFDGRYKFKLKDDLSSDFQYECYYLDNIPARGWMPKGNKLYFYTDEGQICEYLHGQEVYIDKEILQLEQGDYTLSTNQQFSIEELTFNQSIIDKLKTIGSEKEIYFYGTNIFECVGQLGDGNHSNYELPIKTSREYTFDLLEVTLIRDETLPPLFSQEDKLLFEYEGTYYETRITGDNSFIVLNLDYDDFSFVVGYVYKRVNLYKYSNKAYDVEFTDDSISFKDTYTGQAPMFCLIDERYDENKYPYFEISQPVSCYYHTKLYNFGTSIVAKTISSLTLTSDNSLYSECMFGYRTKYEINYDYQYNYQHGNIIGIDYTDYDYTEIVYDPYNNFAQSFTYPSRIRNFNYIQFAFLNNEDTNCALTSLSIVYSLGVRKRGLN